MRKFKRIIAELVVCMSLIGVYSIPVLAEDPLPIKTCIDHDKESKDPPFGSAEYEKYKLENHHKIASSVDYHHEGKVKTVIDVCKGTVIPSGFDKGRYFITEGYCEDYKLQCNDLLKLKYQQCGSTGNLEYSYCKNCGDPKTCLSCSLSVPTTADTKAMCPFYTICKGGACVVPAEGDPAAPPKPCNDNKVKDEDEKGVDCGGLFCPPCSNVTTDCNEDAKDGGDFYVGGAMSYLQNGEWVPPLGDYCDDAGTLIECTCGTNGLVYIQHACSEGCEMVPYTGTKEFWGEVGQCVMQKQCADNDQWAPVIRTYALGVEVGSYDTKYSVPGSALVTGEDGKTYDACEDTCIDGKGNPVSEGKKLKECACEGDNITVKEYTCPDYSSGCKNGACCFNAEICMDLDGGVRKDKKGNVFFGEACGTSQGSDHFDACGVTVCSNHGDDTVVEGKNSYSCPNDKTKLRPEIMGKSGDAVLEYYCSDFKPGEKGEILSKWLSCGKGSMCLDGACVPGSCKKYSPGQSSPQYDINKFGKVTQPQNCVEGVVIGGEGKAGFGVHCNRCVDTDRDGVKETHVRYECGQATLPNGDVTASDDLYVSVKITKCPIVQLKGGNKGGCIDDTGCIPILPSDIKSNTKLPKGF